MKKFGVKGEEASKRVSRTGQKIIDLVISDPSITAEAMSVKIGVSKRAVEKNIKELRERGILVHEGSDKAGYWRIIVKPSWEGVTHITIFTEMDLNGMVFPCEKIFSN